MAKNTENEAQPLTGMEIQLYQGPNEEVSELESELSGTPIKSRRLSTSRILAKNEVIFRLYKFLRNTEEYLLEMDQVSVGRSDRYHLEVCKKEGGTRWNVEINNLSDGDHFVLPMVVEESAPRFPNKYGVPLQERLVGWSVEKRARVNDKEELFFDHPSRNFRSFKKAVVFILFSCDTEDLVADVATMQISSTNVSNNNGAGQKSDDE